MLRLVQYSCRHLNQSKSSPRFLAGLNTFSSAAQQTESSGNSTGFTPVYKFSYIRIFGLVNRLKLYQTVLTVAGTPVSFILSTTNLVNADFGFAVGALGLSGCILLYTLGFLTNKFVGFIYINENQTEAKISYADFWGRRKDKQIPINDIIPFSDITTSITDDFYTKFKTYSSNETLRLNLKFGQILDKDGFKTIFIRDA